VPACSGGTPSKHWHQRDWQFVSMHMSHRGLRKPLASGTRSAPQATGATDPLDDPLPELLDVPPPELLDEVVDASVGAGESAPRAPSFCSVPESTGAHAVPSGMQTFVLAQQTHSELHGQGWPCSETRPVQATAMNRSPTERETSDLFMVLI
jgi:hypothetical protein